MDGGAGESPDAKRLEQERDLYLRLLNLGLQDDLEPFLEEALALVTQIVDAHQGYLEIGSMQDSPEAARWSVAHGFSPDQVTAVRSSISRGIIAAALQAGETIVTRSALHDERFEARQSVQDARIEAVICVPIGSHPPFGAVYLHRRIEPGPFLDEHRKQVELFARHLAPFADRLIARSLAASQSDPTEPYRQRLRLNGVIGHSQALADVLRDVSFVAALDVDILLTGESGTGKSQIARVIHDNSGRAAHPFVELNCAAIPETLIESELFGALPGSHSAATRRVEGKLAAAQRGTLFLDEIGELAPPAQAKLLQLLQSRIYYPLGAAKPVQADLRIVAATNIDLEVAVREGRFREDLYYRLAVMPIRLPTLAERRADIAEMAAFFCSEACARHRLPRVTLSPQLLDALSAAEWPGNVRQLSHAIEAAAIRAGGSGLLQIERSHVFPPDAGPASRAAPADGSSLARGLTFQDATRTFQARLLRSTLEETGWNVLEAARRLELARSHVYTLMRGFGIERTR
jgi:Nif-specific regulatory protein